MSSNSSTFFIVLSTLLLTTACVNMPSGPSVMVLPDAGQCFDQFRNGRLRNSRLAAN